MSTPACSALTCLFCGTPPKMVVTRRPEASASGCSVAVIWVASSRVGARTRPEGRDDRRVVSASRLTSGMENASVLPLPGLAPTEHVAAGQSVRQGRDLDREGMGDAAVGQCAHQ